MGSNVSFRRWARIGAAALALAILGVALALAKSPSDGLPAPSPPPPDLPPGSPLPPDPQLASKPADTLPAPTPLPPALRPGDGWSSAPTAPTPRPRQGSGPLQRPLETSPYAVVPPPGPAPQRAPAPGVLDRPLETNVTPGDLPPPPPVAEPLVTAPFDPPQGFTGKSSVRPTEDQENSHFVPVFDRWRTGFPEWDRDGKPQKHDEDAPYDLGHWYDPFNQNVLKGDYPIIGQHTFLNVTAALLSLDEGRLLPTPQNNFDSANRQFGQDVFGRPNQFLTSNFFSLSLDLFHGDAAFKPVDWRVKLTPVFNFNDLSLEEVGNVTNDVRSGTDRGRTFFALQEWFLETKLADLSPDYDFVSIRAGSQPFVSDFRGFLFSDTNRGVRLFGTLEANRDQFNLAVFKMLEKDTNSQLNTFDDRRQTVAVANFFRQDFLFPGYTAEWSVTYNSDRPSFKFDKNGFLVRPDPVGVFTPHGLDVVYLGFGGDGHIGPLNITNQFYWALGRDSLNPLANQGVDINAQMAAVELSYDRDWARFRTSFFWASGDSDINNSHATGFDTIMDNPNFAGGEFSFWQRQQIGLLGVSLVNRNSLVPDLRSSKFQGQSNFVNPGLVLFNGGVDFDLTPKLRWINNCNFLFFDETGVLQQFVFQRQVRHFIGTDISTGLEYRPLLSNNVIMRAGAATLLPGRGFKDLYNNLNNSIDPLVAGFVELNLVY
jgi:hypothetical protein